MKWTRVCTACIAAAALVGGSASLTSERVSGETRVAQNTPSPSGSLMRQKLQHAQKLLEALSIGDFIRITSNAEELQRISLEARWTMPHSPEYSSYGDEFRASLERVVRSSENGSIDGAALGYVQVILTCVQCHKVVREGEEFALLDDDQLEGLLEQQISAIGAR